MSADKDEKFKEAVAALEDALAEEPAFDEYADKVKLREFAALPRSVTGLTTISSLPPRGAYLTAEQIAALVADQEKK